MPSAYVGKVADMAGVSMKTAEVFWKEAKAAAGKSYAQGSEKFWGTVTKIFKNKARKHLGVPLPEAEVLGGRFRMSEQNNFDRMLESLK